MTCDFCDCDLPLVFATNDQSALFRQIYQIQTEDDAKLSVDVEDNCVYEYWETRTVKPAQGFQHLCKKCACKLDAFGSRVLEDDCHRRVKNARNTATNILNANAKRDIPLYMVAFDIAIKDHPVAQISRKEGDRIIMTNMVHGESVGHLLKYMEGR